MGFITMLAKQICKDPGPSLLGRMDGRNISGNATDLEFLDSNSI